MLTEQKRNIMTEKIIFYLAVLVFMTLLSAFFILLMKKWGIIEYVQIHGDRFFSEMAGCDFCLSFWVNSFVAFCLVMYFGMPELLVFGMFGCPITRMLV